LVIDDITLKVLQSITLFGILNGFAVFIRESHTRMDVWATINSRKRVCTISETRWWSKDASLTKIFGNFNNSESGIFVDLILTLTEIETSSSIKSEAFFKASGLRAGLYKYETIITAQMYLRIFEKTTPLSKYLQGIGINKLTAYLMVTQILQDLRKCAREFSKTKDAADKFVQHTNEMF
jgi:hypothetical protein